MVVRTVRQAVMDDDVDGRWSVDDGGRAGVVICKYDDGDDGDVS